MASPENNSSSSSVELVISKNDLLTEILVRLPVLSLVFFKSVSKRWNSLIKQHAAASLTLRRNLDPLSGLFIQRITYPEFSFSYEFVRFDIRIPLLAPSFTDVHSDVSILQSCNGLFLCHSPLSGKYYVYNPSVTNKYKMIPEPDNVTFDDYVLSGGLILAFDTTKSPHYKVIYKEFVAGDHHSDGWVQMHTYSSETGNWSLCGHHFPVLSFDLFRCGVYWNDAIYWIKFEDKIFKLDIMNENPVFTALQPPLTSYLTVHNTRKLFVSHGCLLLFAMENDCSQHFTIFEKSDVYSEGWSVKYVVNLDDIIKPFPKRSFDYPRVYFILLGEREDDSVLVMELDKKVVRYKIALKTVDAISALGPNDDLVKCFEFIPSFVNV